MKKLFLTLVILGFLANIAHPQSFNWVVLNPASIPGTPDFSDLYFTDPNTGWISSSNTNIVFKTTDGGTNFATQNTILTTEAIHMVSATEGYCGGASGFVYRTADGGVTWPFGGTITNTLTDISFPSGGGTGYACGFNGAVWSVTSGGVTNLNSGLANTFNGISSPSVNNVWICGGSYIYYYNGSNFTEQFAPSGTFNAIYFINNLEGWVVGDSGIIARTINGGESWEVQRISGSGSSLFDVFFLNANEGWAVGANGTILHTTNGGTNWNVEGSGLTTAFLRGVHFTSSTNGYVVGNIKTLLKYTQLTSVNNVSENYLSAFNPNPTTGKVKITTLSNQQLKSVCIYNSIGCQQECAMDIQSNEIDLTSLPSGIYVIKIVTNKQSFSQKIIKQ